jgi:hypothetical protein
MDIFFIYQMDNFFIYQTDTFFYLTYGRLLIYIYFFRLSHHELFTHTSFGLLFFIFYFILFFKSPSYRPLYVSSRKIYTLGTPSALLGELP